MIRHSRYKWFLLVTCIGLSVIAKAQEKKDSTEITDTVKSEFVTTVEEKGSRELRNRAESFRNDRTVVAQHKMLAEIRRAVVHAKEYLKSGIDTADIDNEITNLDKWYDIAGDGVFTNYGSTQTHRNLVTSYKIIHELRKRATAKKLQVDRYYKDLMNFRLQLDSLASDSLLYVFAPDSAEAAEYAQQLIAVGREIIPTDSILKTAIPRIRSLQKRIDVMVSSMNSGMDEIDRYQATVFDNSLDREVPNLWAPVKFSRPFGEILRFSKAKVLLGLYFYMKNNTGKLFLLVLLILTGTFFLRSLRKKAKAENKLGSYRTGQLILRYPLLSAIFIVFNVFQFIFYDPPFIFNFLLWAASAFCLTAIFRGFISKFWMQAWLTVLVVFLITCVDNLILQASRTGRWLMVLIALVGIIVCLVTLSKGHRDELRERSFIYFIGLVCLFELTSIILNLAGRYNLSKTLLVTGFVGVIVGVLLVWTVRIVDEGLKLASDMYKSPEGNLLYINFDRVGKRVPRIIYVLTITGWFVIFGRNFYAFGFITAPLNDFLYDVRTVGEFTFAIYNILIFFVILVVSMLLSKLVSFFASDSNSWHGSRGEFKSGIGSWILLIRIFIISVGVLLALAAAGIPMDKAAIVIGALGVGIGLGLQSLVNNLVSGLIIAFEKPVNVGDVVEVAGKSGTIRTIGFRSSIINTWDGADVVIPNGDLLNAHLVNWTRGNTLRRVEVKLGVAVGSDINKVKDLVIQLLDSNEKILKYPSPSVIANDFSNNALNLSVYFWVSHTREWLAMRSELIFAINNLLKENEIEFSVPEQNLFIRNDASKDNKNQEAKNQEPNKNTKNQ